MNFTLSIILRYLRARRGFTRVVTGFSVGGIVLGVAALIVVMAVMAGFREELLGRILGMSGHATVVTPGLSSTNYAELEASLRAIPTVVKVEPIVQGQAMLSAKGRAGGGFVRGMNFAQIPAVIKDNIVDGALATLSQPHTVAIGEELARQLGIVAGDVVTLLSPDGAQTAIGFIPRMVQVRVGALFDTGSQIYDRALVVAPLPLAQQLFKLGLGYSGVEVMVQNPMQISMAKEAIQAATPLGTVVQTWEETNKPFFYALQIERMTMFIILSLIILVAAFNIITGQMMLVTDKIADIAILRTMGATRAQVLRIFLLNGLLLGLGGTALGLGLGVLIVENLTTIVGGLEAFTGTKIFAGDVYPIDTMPARLVWLDVAAVLGMSVTLTVLASFYPAWRASKLEPVEGLK